MIYFLCFILFCIGLYCILVKKNIIKIIIGISIIDYSLYLFLVLIGYRMQGRSPIHSPVQRIENMVDPLPPLSGADRHRYWTGSSCSSDFHCCETL